MARRAVAVLAGNLALAGGCPSPPPAPSAETEVGAAATRSSPPADSAGFLAMLLPVIDSGVKVSYRVEGAGSLRGSLEIRAREGGFRRQDWRLELPAVDGGVVAVSGSVIETPEWIWIGDEGEVGERHPRSLAAVARAYAALDAPRRAAVAETVRMWQADLAEARERHPGERRRHLGIDCLSTRVAGQSLCLWEEAGLPLLCEAAAFSVEATQIDRDQRFEDSLFAVPAGAVADEVGVTASTDELLDALAEGNYAPIAELTAVRLTLPTAAAG